MMLSTLKKIRGNINSKISRILCKYYPSIFNSKTFYTLPFQRNNIMGFMSARVGSVSDNKLGGWYAYRSSKAALNMMIKNLSIEVGRRNKKRF